MPSRIDPVLAEATLSSNDAMFLLAKFPGSLADLHSWLGLVPRYLGSHWLDQTFPLYPLRLPSSSGPPFWGRAKSKQVGSQLCGFGG